MANQAEILIDSCGECPHQAGIKCYYITPYKELAENKYNFEIPDWCPLLHVKSDS